MPSSDRIDFHELEIKILNELIDLSEFCCLEGDTMGLDEFIHKEALAYQEEKLGITHLFLYKDRLVGFATLAMTAIPIKEPREFLSFSVPFHHFPALLIGRLAVDNEFRKRNIGRNICLWVLGFAEDLAKQVGCRFITVLTESQVVEFYERCGFMAVDKTKKKVIMFKQIPP